MMLEKVDLLYSSG
uniref:Uncharacterized protein n=1 Tax=Anguilla anguilla TaxID=7936 RepID=A0A0E9Y0J1_ANGAN